MSKHPPPDIESKNERRRRYQKGLVGDDHRTFVHIFEIDRPGIHDLARGAGEHVPRTISKLVHIALSMIEGSDDLYRQRWQNPPPDGIISTYAFLSEESHALVVELARVNGLRMPAVVARLVHMALNVLQTVGGDSKGLQSGATSVPADTDATNSGYLTLIRYVAMSNYAGDTMTTRNLANSLISLIFAHGGNPITAPLLAEMLRAHISPISKMIRILEERQIIKRISTPNASRTNTRRAHLLSLRPDAVEAFRKHHLNETGIDLAMVVASYDQIPKGRIGD